MSIHEDLRKLKTGARDLRKFGLTVGGVFVLLGVLFLLRHRSSYPSFLGAGSVLMAFAGSSISKRFPCAKMGQTGGELLDSVRE
jgi:hypothetical protein